MPGALGLGTIFDNNEIMIVCNVQDLIQASRVSEPMHGADGPSHVRDMSLVLGTVHSYFLMSGVTLEIRIRDLVPHSDSDLGCLKQSSELKC